MFKLEKSLKLLFHITITMFLIRVQDTKPITDATFLFKQFINEKADLDFNRNSFSIIASNPSLRFIARFYISKKYCQDFFINQTHIAKISLPSFSDTIMTAAATRFDTMSITLPSPYKMTLTFETSSEYLLIPHNNIAKNYDSCFLYLSRTHFS